MKRFLLLGILLFSYSFSFSQKITKPTRNPSIVCVETEMEIKFAIKGVFGTGSNFEVLLSDVNNDFSNAFKIGSTPYVDGQDLYTGVYSVSGVPVDKYYIKIVSTDPSTVESPVSKRFSVVENDPVSIVADGPTEFCDGGGVNLVTQLSFDNRLFEWYRVSSPNDESLGSYQEFRAEESGTYYAVSVVGSCVEKSEEITVVETTAPVSLIAEVDQEVCYPNPGVFTAASTDVESPYYEWLDENGEVKGVGETFSTNVAGTYSLRTTNYGNLSPGGGCGDISGPVTLTVHNFEAKIIESGPIKECSGAEITLTSSEVNPEYIYNWKLNGSILPDPISGKGKVSYTFISQESDSGNYTLEVISPVCTKESSPSLEVDIKDSPTPSIVEVDQKGCEGSVVTLTSGFDDLNNDYNYQWYLGTNLISGANSKTIDVIISTSTQGDYYLEMSFANCSVKSAPVNVKLVKTPVSLINPEGEAIACEGEQVTLAAVSENIETATYSWIDSNDLEVGTGIEFITSTPGDYRLVTLNDGVCSNTSPVTTVIISPIPESKIKDTKLSDCTLVVLEAESDLKGADSDRVIYKWYKDDILVPIQEGVSPVLNVSESGDYKLETLNYGVCGDITAPVTVSIKDLDPSINEGTDPVLLCVDSEYTLVAVETDPTYTYIWSRELVGSGVLEELQSSNLPSYIIKSISSDIGEWDYTLRVKSLECDKTSDAITVEVYPLAESKIKDASFLDCEKVVLEAESDLHGGDPTKVIYRWYKDDITTPIQEGNNSVLNVYESGSYKLETLNYGMCGDISAPVTVVINDLDPSIDESADPVLVCVDSDHTLTAVETDPTYTYIWSRELVGSGVSEELQNSNLPSYLIKGVSSDVGEWDYTLRVISPECDKTSDAVNVVIPVTPIADISPDVDQTVCADVTLKSVGVNPGTNITYQWFKDGGEISSATGIEFTVTEAGDYYFKVFNYDVCESISKTVNVSFVDFEHGIAEGDVVKECEEAGQFLQLTSINIDTKYTYKWFKGTQEVGNTMVLDVERLKENSGLYSLEVTEGGCSKMSDPVDVIILEVPVSLITDAPSKYCDGESFTISSKENNTDYDYTWFYNDVEITGSTSGGMFENYDTPTLLVTMDNSTVGDYQVKVSVGNCGGSISPKVKMEIHDKFDIYVDVYPSTVLCANGSIDLTVTASVNVSKYTWLKNGSAISGANESSFEVTSPGTYVVVIESEVTGCSQQSDEIVITPAPDMGVVEDVIYVNNGETAIFEGFGGDNYKWFDDKGVLVQDGAGNTFEVKDEDNTTYQLEVSNESCTSDLIKLLVVVKGITADDIQNMMTPNGDGFNDVWKMPSGFVTDGDEVIILNRQGSIVYRSNNYIDDWGGTLNDGPALPAATYYYVIRRKGKEPIMGSIMIFR